MLERDTDMFSRFTLENAGVVAPAVGITPWWLNAVKKVGEVRLAGDGAVRSRETGGRYKENQEGGQSLEQHALAFATYRSVGVGRWTL